jgi:hypothetical protein
VAATLIAAAAGIVGLLLGRFWDCRSESSRWRRDQQVRAFDRLAEEFHLFYEAVRAVALLAPGTSECDGAVSRARDVGTGWDRAMAAAWLYGPQTVARAARTVDDRLTKLWVTAQERRMTPVEWTSACAAARLAMESLVDENPSRGRSAEARRGSVPPLASTRAWSGCQLGNRIGMPC